MGPGGFSAYVAEALEQRVAMDKLGELVADFEKDNEPLARAEVDKAKVESDFRRRRRGSRGSVTG
ncbi:hypothetical protein ACL02S_08680 [Nocardia sp. 004]|uniref:hypothetical protein n=1 Tax=Nocardia sp. 004 TaxID=3385978 RepID=UPI0039A3C83E